jgi:hypothetical protein
MSETDGRWELSQLLNVGVFHSTAATPGSNVERARKSQSESEAYATGSAD